MEYRPLWRAGLLLIELWPAASLLQQRKTCSEKRILKTVWVAELAGCCLAVVAPPGPAARPAPPRPSPSTPLRATPRHATPRRATLLAARWGQARRGEEVLRFAVLVPTGCWPAPPQGRWLVHLCSVLLPAPAACRPRPQSTHGCIRTSSRSRPVLTLRQILEFRSLCL